MNTKQDIENFFGSSRIAIIGLSRNPKSYSRTVLRELQKRDYTVIGINPNPPDIEGISCFASLHDINDPVATALILLPPAQSDPALQSCLDANVRTVWNRGAEGKRSVSDNLIGTCDQQGVRLIDGYCPLMFMEHPGFPHNLHRAFAKWFQMMPKE